MGVPAAKRKNKKKTKGKGFFGDNDYRANFSNYGVVIYATAPGVCIDSTRPGGKDGLDSGTSMADPHVAGAAANRSGTSKPESLEDVKAILSTIVAFTNEGWTDAGDGAFEGLRRSD